MNDKENMVGGFLKGLFIGGLIGVMFAPKPGKELRDELKGTAEDKIKIIKDKKDSAADKISELKMQVEEKIREISLKADDKKDDFKKEKEKMLGIIADLQKYIEAKEAEYKTK